MTTKHKTKVFGHWAESDIPALQALNLEEQREPKPFFASGYQIAQWKRDRDQYKAHAQALAEALAAMVAAANRADVKMRDSETYQALPSARTALAAWKARGQ